MTDLVPKTGRQLAAHSQGLALPALIHDAGTRARRRYVEFFTAQIRNRNTRAAYGRACGQFFTWCDDRGISSLEQLEPVMIAAYIESHPGAAPTVKQHLAALRMLFDWLVTGHVLETNPAGSVRGPRYSAKRGKTPVRSPPTRRARSSTPSTSESRSAFAIARSSPS